MEEGESRKSNVFIRSALVRVIICLFFQILTLLVLLTALSDAKKKGKKKSHKKKASPKAESAIEPQNAEQKSTLFPKPVKKLVGSDISDEKSTSSKLLLAMSTTLTTEGPIGLAGSKGPVEMARSLTSVGLTGSTTSVGSTGSTASVGLTGTTLSVGLTASTPSIGLTVTTTSVASTGSTASVGSTVLSGKGVELVGPTTLGPKGSTVKLSSLETIALVGSVKTVEPVKDLVPAGILKTGNESTVKQTTVNITTTTQRSNSSNVTTTEQEIDNNDYDDEMENEEAPAEDNRADELSFIHDFRQSNDDPNFSKYEQEDDETFITDPMPEYRRKKRHFTIPYADSRKKR